MDKVKKWSFPPKSVEDKTLKYNVSASQFNVTLRG